MCRIAFLFWLVPVLSFAQLEVDAGLEYLLSRSMEEEDPEELINSLVYYFENPLSVNTCDMDDLFLFPFFSSTHVQHIATYIKRTGGIRSAKEFLLIPQFNEQLIAVIQPFISYSGRGGGRSEKPGSKKVYLKLKWKKSLDSGFNQLQISKKLELNEFLTNWNLQLNYDKDKGERFFYNQYQPEHLSFNLNYEKPERFLQKVVIGDFKMKLARGLILSSGFNTAKMRFKYGSASFSQKKIVAFNSFTEYDYFKGLASRMKLIPNWNIVFFVSRKKEDAKVELNEQGNRIVTTLYHTGYHTTEIEIANRDKLKLYDVGASLEWNNNSYSISLNHCITHFSDSLLPNLKYYNHHYPSGKKFYNQSVGFQGVFREKYVGGELAIDKNLHPAFIVQVEGEILEELQYSLLYRNYHKKYQSFRGKAYQQQGALQNEKGLSSKWGIALVKNCQIDVLLDLFKFPNMKYRSRFPSIGMDRSLDVRYNFHDNDFVLTYRTKMRQENYLNSEGGYQQRSIKYELLGFRYYSIISERWKFKSNVTITKATSKLEKENGVLLSAELMYKGNRTKINSGVASYYTSDYKARIYSYESSLQYGNPFRMYHGKGTRVYTKISQVLTERFVLALKAAYDLSVENSIAIESEKLNTPELSFQMKVKF